ncbi:MAG: resolvase [Epsilonproteobacteria bacterium]|nr:MAG: resolvase [Campylobacterota bacterium]RLA63740.1 MAG: resolvase [Campylobacterota bacterium]
MQKRVAIYARVSTSEQKSLEAQSEKMKAYIKSRDWFHVKSIEEVASGAKTRPKRQELLRMARRREIDVIIVWKLDRWGRSVQDVTGTLNELQELGVGFVSITEALDFTTTMGRAMAGLLSVFAEFERDILRERVRSGLEHARAKGIRLGRPGMDTLKKKKVLSLHRRGMTKSEIERQTGISRRSIGRICNE